MIAFRESMSIPRAPASLDFAIGPIAVRVDSDLREVVDDLADLYGRSCRPGRDGDPVIAMAVRARRRWLGVGNEYTVYGDGERLWSTQDRREVLPLVEWGINWRVISRSVGHLVLHAAVLARDGAGVILAGESGFGKSTLAAALIARGWSYLSDELALIHPETLAVHPFPKALCVKAEAFAVIQGLGLPLWRRRHYVKALKGPVGYISPREVQVTAAGGPCRVECIFFPRYAQGQQPHLAPLPKAQALISLAGLAFNRAQFGSRTTTILGGLVRQARCGHLRCGPIGETCDLLQDVFSDLRPRIEPTAEMG